MTHIYIDDSGNSGMKSFSRYDAKDKSTWYAIIMTTDERNKAFLAMNML